MRLLTLALLLALAPAAVAQPRPDTLGKIRAAKAVAVAYAPDALPFSFAGADARPEGYSIDLCKRVVAAVGRTVGEPDLAIRWLPGGVGERLAMVASGRAELDCANTTATLGRMREVDFSNPIFVDAGGLMVRADGPVARLSDLAGRRVAVVPGTTTEVRLAAMLKQRGIAATVLTVRDAGAGFAALGAGEVDALASDKIRLAGLASQGKGAAGYALLPEDLSFEPYAFALPRGDAAFRLEVNRALGEVYGSGEIDAIFTRWLGKLGRPSGLLAAMYLLNVFPD